MKRFTDTENGKYDLMECPPYIKYVFKENDPDKPKGLKWSNIKDVPKIGDNVRINFNQLGTGIVESYFIEYDWLGICVKLDKIPEWKQKRIHNKDVALVIGAELEY